MVTVVAPDVFSLGGLTALGEWLRPGDTRPGGYIFGHAPPPVLASENARARWVDRVVAGYHAHVLGTQHGVTDPRRDPSCLGIMRNYSSLMSMAEESRKPMFSLTAADGALGSHAAAAQQAYGDFAQLADRVAAATWRRNPA